MWRWMVYHPSTLQREVRPAGPAFGRRPTVPESAVSRTTATGGGLPGRKRVWRREDRDGIRPARPRARRPAAALHDHGDVLAIRPDRELGMRHLATIVVSLHDRHVGTQPAVATERPEPRRAYRPTRIEPGHFA